MDTLDYDLDKGTTDCGAVVAFYAELDAALNCQKGKHVMRETITKRPQRDGLYHVELRCMHCGVLSGEA